jgi:hypothetical protein
MDTPVRYSRAPQLLPAVWRSGSWGSTPWVWLYFEHGRRMVVVWLGKPLCYHTGFGEIYIRMFMRGTTTTNSETRQSPSDNSSSFPPHGTYSSIPAPYMMFVIPSPPPAHWRIPDFFLPRSGNKILDWASLKYCHLQQFQRKRKWKKIRCKKWKLLAETVFNFGRVYIKWYPLKLPLLLYLNHNHARLLNPDGPHVKKVVALPLSWQPVTQKISPTVKHHTIR